MRARGLDAAVAVCALHLAACQAAPPACAAPPEPAAVEGWRVHPLEPRVRYAQGSEGLADTVAELLPAALVQVEDALGLPFDGDVAVTVYGDLEAFHAETGAPPYARGIASALGVSLSPRLRDWPGTERGILVHELVHVRLARHLGALRSSWAVPRWFHEGLATLVSGGGGAEGFTDEEALALLRTDPGFTPGARPTLAERTLEVRTGRNTRLVYRQFALFVGDLRARDPERFGAFLRALEGSSFAREFPRCFDVPVERAWERFLAGT